MLKKYQYFPSLGAKMEKLLNSEINDEHPLEIIPRHFESMDEIMNLSGFKEENPVGKLNYECIIGHYNFPAEVSCCWLKENGNLCKTNHKIGFVVRLKDNSTTLLGNHCANTKVDAGDKIRIDAKFYLREKKRRESIKHLKSLLMQKEEIISLVDGSIRLLEMIERSVNRFLPLLPEIVVRKLKDMEKSRNTLISVDSIIHKEENDKNGNKYTKTIRQPINIGKVSGLKLIKRITYSTIQKELIETKESINSIENINIDNLRSKDLNNLSAKIKRYRSISQEVYSMNKIFMGDFKAGLKNIIYLAPDRGDRYKTAKIIIDYLEGKCSSANAKTWVQENDNNLKAVHKVDKIFIA